MLIELGRVLDDQRASRTVKHHLGSLIPVARTQARSTQRLSTGGLASALHIFDDHGRKGERYFRPLSGGLESAAPCQRLFESLGWGDK